MIVRYVSETESDGLSGPVNSDTYCCSNAGPVWRPGATGAEHRRGGGAARQARQRTGGLARPAQQRPGADGADGADSECIAAATDGRRRVAQDMTMVELQDTHGGSCGG